MKTQVQLELVFVHPKIQVCETEDDDAEQKNAFERRSEWLSIDRSMPPTTMRARARACVFFAFRTSVFFALLKNARNESVTTEDDGRGVVDGDADRRDGGRGK